MCIRDSPGAARRRQRQAPHLLDSQWLVGYHRVNTDRYLDYSNHRQVSGRGAGRAPLGATFDTIVALGCGRERLVVSTARARV